MVWNYQNADCSFEKNVVLLKCIGTLLFPVGNASEPAAMRCFAVITAATSSSSDAQRCRFVQQNVVDDSKHSCSAQLCSGARVMVSRHRINWSLQLTERRASGKLRTIVLRTAPNAYEWFIRQHEPDLVKRSHVDEPQMTRQTRQVDATQLGSIVGWVTVSVNIWLTNRERKCAENKWHNNFFLKLQSAFW